MGELWWANLYDADPQETNLYGADLGWANLDLVDFYGL
jgi:uncharacterized protein YjbI with pentapeptide repeats